MGQKNRKTVVLTIVVLVGIALLIGIVLSDKEINDNAKNNFVLEKHEVKSVHIPSNSSEVSVNKGTDTALKKARDDNRISAEKQKLQRSEVLARRKLENERREVYRKERRVWRRALNKARQKAKLTGDYSEYEALKNNEPIKD